MNSEELEACEPGLYLVFWSTEPEKISKAIVTRDHNNYARLMCTDWVGSESVTIRSYAGMITKMVRIT